MAVTGTRLARTVPCWLPRLAAGAVPRWLLRLAGAASSSPGGRHGRPGSACELEEVGAGTAAAPAAAAGRALFRATAAACCLRAVFLLRRPLCFSRLDRQLLLHDTLPGQQRRRSCPQQRSQPGPQRRSSRAASSKERAACGVVIVAKTPPYPWI
jgi:hypothetical protein